MAFRFFPEAGELNCSKEDFGLCLNSYFALAMAVKGCYWNRYCAVCHGLKNLTNEMCQRIFLFPNFIDKPPHFKLLISFDENGKSNSELVTVKPICPYDQYFDIFTNDCKNKLHHACAKSILGDEDPVKPFHITNQSSLEMQLSLPNKMFQCIKRIGGAALGFSRISKELEHMETNQAVSLWNYTIFLLADQKIDEFVDPWNKSIYFIIVPYKVLPFTRLYGFSLHHHFLRGRVLRRPRAN